MSLPPPHSPALRPIFHDYNNILGWKYQSYVKDWLASVNKGLPINTEKHGTYLGFVLCCRLENRKIDHQKQLTVPCMSKGFPKSTHCYWHYKRLVHYIRKGIYNPKQDRWHEAQVCTMIFHWTELVLCQGCVGHVNLYLGKALFTEASQSLALWMERDGLGRFVSIWEYYIMEVFF